MEKSYNKSKGITIVSLIVTVIILLILAGISIASLTGNGLFKKAKLAKEKQENAEIEEDAKLLEYETLIAQYVSSSREVGEMTTEELTDFIKAVVKTELNSSSSEDTMPTGTVISYMGNNAPEGYLFCDGTEYKISNYKNLAEQIKSEFGSYNYYGGNGTTTFAVPNLQGEFLRGYSTSSTSSVTSGITTENVGIHQEATYSPFLWNYATSNGSDGWITGTVKSSDEDASIGNYDNAYNLATRIIYSQSGGHYTIGSRMYSTYTSRPTNTSVLYCIKY